MEKTNAPIFKDGDAKDFHNAVHGYEIVDGNPLTIGHALKDLPKNTFSHDRIYDVEYVSVNVRANIGTAVDVSRKVNGTVLPHVSESSYNGVSSQLNMSRCDGEVMTWSHASHAIPALEDGVLIYEEDLEESFNKPYTLNALVPVKEGVKLGEDPFEFYGSFQIKGKPARYVVEPIYAVDPDVVQDL